MCKVILRKLTTSDVDDLLAINLNPDVTKYIPYMIRDRSTLLSWINGLGPTDHEFMILLPHPTARALKSSENAVWTATAKSA